MRRIIGSEVIGFVAGEAFQRRAGVLSACVTLSAIRAGVSTGQREIRQVVIEGRVIPIGGSVALGTVGRVAICRVIGIGCSIIIGFVTGEAFAGLTAVRTTGMALAAGRLKMRSGQGEAGGIMVK